MTNKSDFLHILIDKNSGILLVPYIQCGFDINFGDCIVKIFVESVTIENDRETSSVVIITSKYYASYF